MLILSASNFWPVTQRKYVFITVFLLLSLVSVSKDLKVPVSTVIERELQKLLGNKDLKQFNSDFLERHSRSLLHRLSGNDHMFVCHFLLFSDLSSFETRGFPSGLWRMWRRLDQAWFIGIIRDATGHRTIHEPRWFFQCYKYQYLNNQSTPA